MKSAFSLMTAIFLTAVAASAWAGAGVSTAQVFQQDVAARPAAMANAFVASGGDLSSLSGNPAGLNELTSGEVQFMHAAGLEGLATEFLALGVPMPGLGVVALHALYRGQPAIDNAVVGEAPVDVKDIVFGLALAKPIAFEGKLILGASAKLALITLGPVETSALAVDAGFDYRLNERLTLGLAGRNLGPGVKIHATEDPLPSLVMLGGRYLVWNEDPHVFAASLQADYLIPEQDYTFRAGGEYWFRKMLALRLGYSHSRYTNVKGVAGGVGFKFKAGRVSVTIDYSFVPQIWTPNDFDSQSMISLGVLF